VLFFEKKNQKTFATWHTWSMSKLVAHAKGQKFFASLFLKEKTFVPYPSNRVNPTAEASHFVYSPASKRSAENPFAPRIAGGTTGTA